MITLHPHSERGHSDYGWLNAYHSFSFGAWYDPQFMGVSALRVINEDRIRAQTGFATHPHDNMEILTYVLNGVISHQDSMGNHTDIKAGEIQLMSAGTGIRHSEMNRQPHTETHMLQIWIRPNVQDTKPRYQQWQPPLQHGLQLLVSPTGEQHSLEIQQNVRIYRVQLNAGDSMTLPLQGQYGYLHVVRGQLSLPEQLLTQGDALTSTETLTLNSHDASEALWFDLP